MQIDPIQIQIFLFILSGLGSILTTAITASVIFIYKMSKSINELNKNVAIIIVDRENDHVKLLDLDNRVSGLERDNHISDK